MAQQEPLILEPLLNENKIKRRSLLPTWMKIIIWIFMLTGALAPLCILTGLLGAQMQLALYGLESQDPLTLMGMFILLLFLYKGVVAYGLWTGRSWAIDLGMADAILGIVVCVYVMAIRPFLINDGFVMNIRLELVALVPYLIRLRKIKPQWEHH